jgi:hypothetical protein
MLNTLSRETARLMVTASSLWLHPKCNLSFKVTSGVVSVWIVIQVKPSKEIKRQTN